MPCPVAFDDYNPSKAPIKRCVRNLELHAPIHEITQSELDRMLDDIATEQQIATYLSTSPHFSAIAKRNGRRWISIPQPANQEKDLYQPFEALVKDILIHFNAYMPEKRLLHNAFTEHAEVHKPRRVRNTWTSLNMKNLPILSSLALDEEHVRNWEDREHFDYRTCITPIEIRLYGGTIKKEEEEAYLAQCATYAEKIFNWQPGRRSVCVPLLTKTHVRLYQFDQLGLLRSAWINIHQYPETLVRIVLFTLSQSAVALGAHPSFTWKGEEQYITVDGVKYKTKSCIYEIPKGDTGPCRVWRVSDPEGRERVIKWCWMLAHGDLSEWSILQRLKGLEGVVQMIAHQEEYSMRAGRVIVPDKPFRSGDMLENVIVLDSYGENIENFQSPEQFLLAFRDAVAGLRNMWNAGALHRDLSCRNILLGNPDAEKGFRGVVIDMDRALIIPAGSKLPKANFELGTRLFQSYNVTRSQKLHNSSKTSHDYLDDLESCLWIFLWITLGWECVPNDYPQTVAVLPPLLEALCSAEPSKAADARRKALLNPHTVHIHPSYPPQFEILKTQLIMFFAQNVLHYPKSTKPVIREELCPAADKHYLTVLGYIDQAIEDMARGVVRKARDLVFQADEFSNAGDESEDEELDNTRVVYDISKGQEHDSGEIDVTSILRIDPGTPGVKSTGPLSVAHTLRHVEETPTTPTPSYSFDPLSYVLSPLTPLPDRYQDSVTSEEPSTRVVDTGSSSKHIHHVKVADFHTMGINGVQTRRSTRLKRSRDAVDSGDQRDGNKETEKQNHSKKRRGL